MMKMQRVTMKSILMDFINKITHILMKSLFNLVLGLVIQMIFFVTRRICFVISMICFAALMKPFSQWAKLSFHSKTQVNLAMLIFMLKYIYFYVLVDLLGVIFSRVTCLKLFSSVFWFSFFYKSLRIFL